jgi:hypothetical protein
VASGVAFVAVLLAVLLLYRKRQNHRKDDDDYHQNHKNVAMVDDGFGGSHNGSTDLHNRPLNPGGMMGGNGNHSHPYASTHKDDLTERQYVTTTNEIWVDPNADDVNRLGGGTLPETAVGTGGDEPTAWTLIITKIDIAQQLLSMNDHGSLTHQSDSSDISIQIGSS